MTVHLRRVSENLGFHNLTSNTTPGGHGHRHEHGYKDGYRIGQNGQTGEIIPVSTMLALICATGTSPAS